MKTSLLVFCCSFAVAFSAIAWYPAERGSSFCDYEGKELEIGQVYYPKNHCQLVECVGKKGRAEGAEIRTCPPLPMTDIPNVKLVQRPELRYPKCCPTIEIDEKENFLKK